jgi:hypothetical protein
MRHKLIYSTCPIAARARAIAVRAIVSRSAAGRQGQMQRDKIKVTIVMNETMV